jgi:hypothetical protein
MLNYCKIYYLITMKNVNFFSILIITLLLAPITSVNGITQGDYHQKFWGGGLNIWVHYPEEAIPGENLSVNVYILSSKFSRGNQVEEVSVTISCLTSSSNKILYDDTILSYVYMHNGDTLNTSIPVSLPVNARWFMTIKIDTISYEQDWSNRQEAHVILDATQIRHNTYNDLEQQILELQAYNAQLGDKISMLQNQLDNFTAIPDTQLEEDYLNLLEEYLELTNLLNQQISNNQTESGDQINTINELESLNQYLTEQIDYLIIQLEDKDADKEMTIIEFEDEIQRLIQENNHMLTELESTRTEYDEYKEIHTISSAEYDALSSNIHQANNTRNILAIISILSIIIAVTVYVRRNT